MNLTPNFEKVVGSYVDWLHGPNYGKKPPTLSLRKMKILYGVQTTFTEINRQIDERRIASAPKTPMCSS